MTELPRNLDRQIEQLLKRQAPRPDPQRRPREPDLPPRSRRSFVSDRTARPSTETIKLLSSETIKQLLPHETSLQPAAPMPSQTDANARAADATERAFDELERFLKEGPRPTSLMSGLFNKIKRTR